MEVWTENTPGKNSPKIHPGGVRTLERCESIASIRGKSIMHKACDKSRIEMRGQRMR